MSSEEKNSEASFAKQSGGKPPQSKVLKLGVQPLDAIMEEQGLKNHDLVAASMEGLTHKQVQKGRKGRRLTRNIQDKIVLALSAASSEKRTRAHSCLPIGRFCSM